MCGHTGEKPPFSISVLRSAFTSGFEENPGRSEVSRSAPRNQARRLRIRLETNSEAQPWAVHQCATSSWCGLLVS